MKVVHLSITPDIRGTMIDHALTLAARAGFDPRNSHPVQAAKWRAVWTSPCARIALHVASRQAWRDLCQGPRGVRS